MQMRGCKYLTSPPVIVSLTIVGLVSLVAGPAAAELRPNWHPGVRAALEAAVSSGKPVYVYIYASARPNASRDLKCQQMEDNTLSNSQVWRALRHFEVCGVDIYEPENQGFLQQHKILPSTEERHLIRTYRLPTNLFLTNRGKEVHRLYGYLPPRWFIQALDNVRALIKAQAAVQANSQDAAAYAQLGHLYLQLQMYDKARVYLNKAVALDPNNNMGAKAEAEVDLNILAIAGNPQQAYSELAKYLKNYPQSPRRLEVRYYMGVAQVAVGNTQKAIEILKTFETSDESAPEYNSPWATPALLLLKSLRQYPGQ